MVHRPPQSSSLKIIFVVGVLLVAAGVYGLLALAFPVKTSDDDEEVEVVATEVEIKKDSKEPKIPKFIDLSDVVEDWASSLGRGINVGLKIYDLNNKKVAAELNPDERFSTASLYKLFIIYEGYKELEQGDLFGNAILVNGKNVSECLDLAIRESDSPCAETLWSKIGRDKIEEIIKNDYQLENSSAAYLYSTPSDMVSLLERYYYHEDLSESSFEKIKDSLLTQPPIKSSACGGTCNFRIGLPSGFSSDVNVYNKVGFESDGVSKWKIYNDAAILEFSNLGRTYLISVFSENLPWSNTKVAALSSLASALEEAISSDSSE